MEDSRIELMRDGKISTAINSMAIPAIISLLMVAIYNIVDTMYVAWLGTSQTGATQVVLPITMLGTAFGFAFGIGGGTYISRLLGMNRKEDADRVGSVLLFTSLIVGILFSSIVLVFLDPLLKFFGASDSVLEHSHSYGFYIVISSSFQIPTMTMNNMLRSEGSARVSMVGQLTGAILNIILDPIFIFVLDMGITGAAIATALSKLVTTIILLTSYLQHKSVIRISLKNFRPSRSIYREASVVGIPTGMRQILISLSVGLMNQGAVAYEGPRLLAAVGIVWKIGLFLFLVFLGFGQGFQPVVGYNIGAENRKRVIESIRYTLIICFSTASVFAIILFCFSTEILSIFRPEPAVLAFGITGLRYTGAAMLLMAVSNTLTVFYQAMGKAKESLLLSISRQGIFLIPMVLILPRYFGSAGILASQFAADVLTLAVTLILFIPYLRSGRLDDDIRGYGKNQRPAAQEA